MKKAKQILKAFSLLAACACLLAIAGSARAQSYPPKWSSSATYAVGDQVQTGGNVYRAISAVPANAANPATNPTDWALDQVKSDTTLLIGQGQTFGTLQQAWSFISNARVGDGVYLHLYISTAKGNFDDTFTAPFLIDHQSGARIAIIGDNVNNIELDFESSNGIIIDTGHSFNTVSNLTIYSENGGNRDGVKADFDATISALSGVVIEDFQNGVHVTQNASVSVFGATLVTGNYTNAFFAETAGSIVIPNGIALVPTGLSTAFEADDGGLIIAPNCNIIGGEDAAEASYGAFIDINTSHVTAALGATASTRGFVRCSYCVFNTTSISLSVSGGGIIAADHATYSTSQSGGASDGSYILT
jgi:hypothetical protein